MIEQFKPETAPEKVSEKEPLRKSTIEEILEKGKGKWQEVKNYLKIGAFVALLNAFSGGVEAQTQEQIENSGDKIEQLTKEAIESEKYLTEKMKINGEKLVAGYSWKTPDGILLENFSGHFWYTNYKDSIHVQDTKADGTPDVITTGDVKNYDHYKKYIFYEKTSDKPEMVVLYGKEKGDIGPRETHYYTLTGDEAKKLRLQVQRSYTNRLNDVVESAKEKAAKEAEEKATKEKAAKEKEAKPFKDLSSKF